MHFGFQAVRAAHNAAEREFDGGAPRSPQQARAHYHPAMPVELRGIFSHHYADHLATMDRLGRWLGAWEGGNDASV